MTWTRPTAAHAARYLVGVVVAVALLALAVPAIGGVAWVGIVRALGAVPLGALGLLAGLWLLGLVAHTVTLTAALPTLSHRRALTLSLTGSAVANVLPLGGAAGMALNYRMLRTWGYESPQFATYTVVTNVWDVVAKLALPVLILPVVLLGPLSILPHLALAAALVAGALVLVAALVATAMTSRRAALVLGSLADRVLGRLVRIVGSTRPVEVGSWLVRTQASCRAVVSAGWGRLTLGMILYTALLFALLLACLTITGAGLSVSVVLVGFAVERLLTLAGITPGGAGVVEVGLTGVLLLLGGSAAAVVPGVLLYRALTFGLEIPVGAGALLGWLVMRHRAAQRGLATTGGLG